MKGKIAETMSFGSMENQNEYTRGTRNEKQYNIYIFFTRFDRKYVRLIYFSVETQPFFVCVN